MLERTKTKIKQVFLSKDFKKSIFFVFLFFFIFLVFRDATFAAAEVTTGDLSAHDSDLAKNMNYIVKFLQYIIGISGSLIWWLTALVTLLLDPSWINWTMFGIWDHIKKIWIFVSNIVYFIFAGILVFISFVNIIWKWWNNFELKKSLPRLVIGILIVPISWFLVQFIISIASVLTVQIFTWPIETFVNNTNKAELENAKVKDWCTEWVINIQWTTSSATNTTNNNNTQGQKFFDCKTRKDESLTKILNLKSDNWKVRIGWVFAIYTFWIMDVWTISKINNKDLDIIKSIFDLWAKVIFDIIFIIVYLIILIALFLVLFVRFIMIWIFMALSPVFWLFYFFWDWKGPFWDMWKKLSFMEFIKLAFVPVYVAAALSFWLMFLLIIWKWLNEPALENMFSGEALDFWPTKLTINWSLGDVSNNNNLIWALLSVWNKGIWVISFLMFKLLWLAFLWIAVMAAIKSPEATKSIVDPFDKLWKSVWNLALELPKYIPVPWTSNLTWGNWNANVWSLLKAWTYITDQLRDNQERQARNIVENLKPVSEEVKRLADKIYLEADKNKFRDALKEAGVDGLVENKHLRNLAATTMENKHNVKPELAEKFRNADSRPRLLEAMEEINEATWLFNNNRSAKGNILGNEYTKTSSEETSSSSSSTSSTNSSPTAQVVNFNIWEINEGIPVLWLWRGMNNWKYNVDNAVDVADSLYEKIQGKFNEASLEAELNKKFNNKVTEIISELMEINDRSPEDKKLYTQTGSSSSGQQTWNS